MRSKTRPWQRSASLLTAATLLAYAVAGEARVTRIVIDTKVSPAFGGATYGTVGQYETLTGRAFGELDPNDARNAPITDLKLAPRNAKGRVEYVASFHIVRPVDAAKGSRLAWHDVPNRGGRIEITEDLRAFGDIGISSAWQGDNAGGTLVPADAVATGAVTPARNEWVKVPVLEGVTGKIVGRIVNRSGMEGQPLLVQSNPIPYFPANAASNAGDVLTVHTHETFDGKVTLGGTIRNADWKYCGGGTFAQPQPATSLPVHVCLREGFDATKLYELVYTVKAPYVLAAGTAAFRDVQSFLRYEKADDAGTPNPLAGQIDRAIVRGVSQSGNFIRQLLFLGMNEDEQGRMVHEGAWPLIAGRRVANNLRWGQPDGATELYQVGSEGPQWWAPWDDKVRHLPRGGILDRCNRTKTCPKIIETFGSAEVYTLKMTLGWVGTAADADIPLPDNVRRYYLPGATHGGGAGGFDENPPVVPFTCPGNNWGRATLRANPMPARELTNRMRVALRDWVLKEVPPPPSRYPTLTAGMLVDPTKAALKFPAIPGVPEGIFAAGNFVNPVLDYDWGTGFDEFAASGVPANPTPRIERVIRMKVPKVDADGNELGGVPTVLNDAPLGTYLGWNVTAGPGDATYDGRPFRAGQTCGYVGGMVPFAKTRAQRVAAGDPRPSLEERYGTHAGYVAAVTAAADKARAGGYLLDGDRDALIAQAQASNVCNQPGDGGACKGAGAAESSLQSRLQRLEDVEAIRTLLERYIDANEARDYQAYSQLFARDGELVMRSAHLTGPQAIREYLERSFGGAANASKGPPKGSAHVLSNIQIEVTGDSATSVCRWILVTPGTEGHPQIGGKGRYEDRLVREDGHWKFKQRAILSDP